MELTFDSFISSGIPKYTCVTQILRLQANDKPGFIIGLDPIPAQG
jgi:hypothetical protein